jgi:hypothetical protein
MVTWFYCFRAHGDTEYHGRIYVVRQSNSPHGVHITERERERERERGERDKIWF